MTNSEDNIRKLMEMLDNPDAYSEQEIRDIIGQDEDTRETYRMMVEIKRSSRRSKNDAPVDVDAAWKRFEQTHYQRRHGNVWMRVAAGFIGLLFVSGISFAAITAVKHHNERKQAQEQQRNKDIKEQVFQYCFQEKRSSFCIVHRGPRNPSMIGFFRLLLRG